MRRGLRFAKADNKRISNHFLQLDYTARRPEMKLTRNITTAITSRIWMNPPIVYELTIPNSHITNKITAIVDNMIFSPLS